MERSIEAKKQYITDLSHSYAERLSVFARLIVSKDVSCNDLIWGLSLGGEFASQSAFRLQAVMAAHGNNVPYSKDPDYWSDTVLSLSIDPAAPVG